jgi:hypothetical protein
VFGALHDARVEGVGAVKTEPSVDPTSPTSPTYFFLALLDNRAKKKLSNLLRNMKRVIYMNQGTFLTPYPRFLAPLADFGPLGGSETYMRPLLR